MNKREFGMSNKWFNQIDGKVGKISSLIQLAAAIDQQFLKSALWIGFFTSWWGELLSTIKTAAEPAFPATYENL